MASFISNSFLDLTMINVGLLQPPDSLMLNPLKRLFYAALTHGISHCSTTRHAYLYKSKRMTLSLYSLRSDGRSSRNIKFLHLDSREERLGGDETTLLLKNCGGSFFLLLLFFTLSLRYSCASGRGESWCIARRVFSTDFFFLFHFAIFFRLIFMQTRARRASGVFYHYENFSALTRGIALFIWKDAPHPLPRLHVPARLINFRKRNFWRTACLNYFEIRQFCDIFISKHSESII